MVQKIGKLLIILLFLWIFSAYSAYAALFDINLTLTGFTTTQESVFDQAEAYWEDVIHSYQVDGNSSLTQLNITADPNLASDGIGGTLGVGGPSSGITIDGYTYAQTGSMSYDPADLGQLETSGGLYNVIVHELAHVIGFGTLWEVNNIYTEGSYQYTGASALAAYQAMGNFGATYVPVENDGGEGTAEGHWEQDVFPNELMTGWLMGSPDAITVSNVTKASFEDLGYNLNPVPLPGALVLLGSGLLGVIGIRRRRA